MKTFSIIFALWFGILQSPLLMNHTFLPPQDFVPHSRWYQDNDGDGFGNPIALLFSTFQPAGYVGNSGDCDDTNSKVNSGILFNYYPDEDNDGLGNLQLGVYACFQPDGYVSACCDCDDHDPLLGSGLIQNYLKDDDGDGFGDANYVIQSCIQPIGYVPYGNLDCDDHNAAVTTGILFPFFPDEDNDGYGNSLEKRFFCNPPEGYVKDNSDCDDTDPKIGKGYFNIYYKDFDQDGYGNPFIATSACQPPKGYVAERSDCDDQDAGIGGGQYTYYFLDHDNDGYGDPEHTVFTCQIPKGYVNNFEDCDDADPGVTIKQIFYLDKDQDGFGGTFVEFACRPSKGYTAIFGDCNDADPTIHPGVKEICNGLDDNCNGNLDEGPTDVMMEGIYNATFCSNDKPFELKGIPSGGQFTIEGLQTTILDPAKYSTDKAHTIEYAIKADGCLVKTYALFKIIPASTPEIFNTKNSFYTTDPIEYLYGNNPDGVFDIDGIKTNYINPSILSPGLHQLSFTIINPGCNSTVSKTIEIKLLTSCPFTAIPNQCYQIINKHSKKVLSILKGSTNNNALTVQTTFENLEHQKWLIENHEDGTHTLYAAHSYKPIEANSTGFGAAVFQKEYNQFYPSGAWKIKCSNKKGYYYIVNPQNGHLLDIMARTTATGAQAITWYLTNLDNQYWQIKTVDCASELLSSNQENNLSGPEMFPTKFKQEEKKLDIYPNPATHFINIQATNFQSQPVHFYDVLGALILKTEMPARGNNLKIDLNPDVFKPGLYLIKIGQGANTAVGKWSMN